VLRPEGVGDVFQESKAEHDALALGGVEVVAELVRRLPKSGLEAECGRLAVRLVGVVRFCACLDFRGNAVSRHVDSTLYRFLQALR
jgi:hypothetical protein